MYCLLAAFCLWNPFLFGNYPLFSVVLQALAALIPYLANLRGRITMNSASRSLSLCLYLLSLSLSCSLLLALFELSRGQSHPLSLVCSPEAGRSPFEHLPTLVDTVRFAELILFSRAVSLDLSLALPALIHHLHCIDLCSRWSLLGATQCLPLDGARARHALLTIP